jgi:hypothetical protein
MTAQVNPIDTMTYHYGTHVPADFDSSVREYTLDALSLRNLLWDTGREVPFRSFVPRDAWTVESHFIGRILSATATVSEIGLR